MSKSKFSALILVVMSLFMRLKFLGAWRHDIVGGRRIVSSVIL